MNKENMKWLIHFNPRPPHGERLAVPILVEYIKQISIHAPRMGSDIPASSKFSMILRFQSTPPAWGATIALNGQFAFQKHFNPRPPHGERRRAPPIAIRNLPFQSTPPAWGATGLITARIMERNISIHAPRMGSDMCFACPILCISFISIHAPRMGSDFSSAVSISGNSDFNPRPPHGERQQKHEISSLFL